MKRLQWKGESGITVQNHVGRYVTLKPGDEVQVRDDAAKQLLETDKGGKPLRPGWVAVTKQRTTTKPAE